jgi:hypothetical protein
MSFDSLPEFASNEHRTRSGDQHEGCGVGSRRANARRNASFITQLGHQPHRAFELNTEVAESRGDFELLGGHRDQDSAACKKSIEADHSMSGRVNLCSSILDRR